jgi:LIVCS family branched-chain amino acid:cation transporter
MAEARSSFSLVIATGLAIFSMFFGAGNVLFPLTLGIDTKDQNFPALAGFLITAVGVPLIGVISAVLFKGDYDAYYQRIGKIPGFLLALFIMALIGPFGAMPRITAAAFASIEFYYPSASLVYFSLGAGITTYLLTYRKSRLLGLLSYILTPVLLGSLLLIIIMGLWTATHPPVGDHTPYRAFSSGLVEGYQTMDLLATVFFSYVIIELLEQRMPALNEQKKILSITLKGGCLGMFLIALIYSGLCLVSSTHAETLQGIPQAQIMTAIAYQLLGPAGSVVAAIAIILACLTTAMALAASFADFIHKDIFMEKFPYQPCLFLTVAISTLISLLGFSGIMKFLVPILFICYPALIVLSICNLFHKVYGWKMVKIPFFVTLVLSTLAYLASLQ